MGIRGVIIESMHYTGARSEGTYITTTAARGVTFPLPDAKTRARLEG